MEKKISLETKLDDILRELNKSYNALTYEQLMEKMYSIKTTSEETEDKEFDICIDNLREDKHVFIQTKPIGTKGQERTKDVYSPTIKGKLFIEKGGYEKEKRLTDLKILTQNIINFSLIFGGVGAGCYYMAIACRWLFHYFCC